MNTHVRTSCSMHTLVRARTPRTWCTLVCIHMHVYYPELLSLPSCNKSATSELVVPSKLRRKRKNPSQLANLLARSLVLASTSQQMPWEMFHLASQSVNRAKVRKPGQARKRSHQKANFQTYHGLPLSNSPVRADAFGCCS